MRPSSRAVATALAALLARAAGPVLAQTPAGGEFRVNSIVTGGQFAAECSANDRGDMVVVWRSDDIGHNVRGQRFEAAGIPLGAEIQANSTLSGYYDDGAVAVAPHGGFVVTWDEYFPYPAPEVLHFRRFTPAGTPLGAEFTGSSTRTGRPAVAATGAGRFVVVWVERGSTVRDVRGQRFDADGARLGSEFQVNSFTTSAQFDADVGADPQGNFTVVWTGDAQDGSSTGIFGQRFAADATPRGVEFRVNTYTTGQQVLPRVSVAGDGRFVVVWMTDAPDGNIRGQRFDADGAMVGHEFGVESTTASFSAAPLVASDASGNFVVAWSVWGAGDGSGSGAFARRFTAAGAARGPQFRLNTTTSDDQIASGVCADGAGNLLATWSSRAQDGDGFGVYAQRFGGLLPSALAVDTAGNLVLEPGESVDVRPSWRNVNGVAQTFSATAPAFFGPLPATYQLADGAGDYGTVASGATARCTDCYQVAVATQERSALHWDATLEERIAPDALGQDKLWRLHLGRSFTDVPASSAFYRFVETLLHREVTAGCGPTTYCPAAPTLREQMAVFVLLAREGAGYRPPGCAAPVFADVPAGSPFCPFVEELVRRGVVSGCGGGNYCPSDAVLREQMAVFVLRTLDPLIDPPPCTTPIFADVPANSPFCRWIEELARRGVVTGCGNGNYCPSEPVTREQMAVFIAATFALILYGP